MMMDVSNYSFEITAAGMRIGERGLAFKYETVVHEEERLISKLARVKLYLNNTDFTRLMNEVEVEKIPEGWLIDGVLHTTCTNECHAGYY